MNHDLCSYFIAGSRDARRIACIVELQLSTTDKVCTRSRILPSKIFKFVSSGESMLPAIVSAGESLFVLFEKIQLLLLGLQ